MEVHFSNKPNAMEKYEYASYDDQIQIRCISICICKYSSANKTFAVLRRFPKKQVECTMHSDN